MSKYVNLKPRIGKIKNCTCYEKKKDEKYCKKYLLYYYNIITHWLEKNNNHNSQKLLNDSQLVSEWSRTQKTWVENCIICI